MTTRQRSCSISSGTTSAWVRQTTRIPLTLSSIDLRSQQSYIRDKWLNQAISMGRSFCNKDRMESNSSIWTKMWLLYGLITQLEQSIKIQTKKNCSHQSRARVQSSWLVEGSRRSLIKGRQAWPRTSLMPQLWWRNKARCSVRVVKSQWCKALTISVISQTNCHSSMKHLSSLA